MMNEQIISFDLKADFGFLKKPDINEGIYLTYNMLHKPAIWGILGAIVGWEGYKKKDQFPEYYDKLKELKIGIEPLNSDKGNYPKTVVQYNNAVGYASQEAGGNLIVKEQILIKPNFRCYLQLLGKNPYHSTIKDYLEKQKAEYLPYFGKNDFSLWWDNFKIHSCRAFSFDRDYRISTIFMKSDQILKNKLLPITFKPFGGSQESNFMCFEELPIGFDERLIQYKKQQFVYTNFKFPKELKIDGLYQLEGKDELIQLF